MRWWWRRRRRCCSGGCRVCGCVGVDSGRRVEVDWVGLLLDRTRQVCPHTYMCYTSHLSHPHTVKTDIRTYVPEPAQAAAPRRGPLLRMHGPPTGGRHRRHDDANGHPAHAPGPFVSVRVGGIRAGDRRGRVGVRRRGGGARSRLGRAGRRLEPHAEPLAAAAGATWRDAHGVGGGCGRGGGDEDEGARGRRRYCCCCRRGGGSPAAAGGPSCCRRRAQAAANCG